MGQQPRLCADAGPPLYATPNLRRPALGAPPLPRCPDHTGFTASASRGLASALLMLASSVHTSPGRARRGEQKVQVLRKLRAYFHG